jgi:23S rRNA (uracil1939-C5)-methyltransferase
MPEPLGKNQVFETVIQGCTSEGQGVARIEGRAVFVKGALPGEKCRIRILKAGKTAVFARVEEMLEPSPNRVEPDCPHFGKCGGCDFRHAAYGEELRLKLGRVNDALQRIGGLDLRAGEILPAPAQDRYRAKAIFNIGTDREGRPVTGFYRARTHEVIPVEDCLLLPDEANRAAAGLRRWMGENRIPAYDEETGRGLIRHLFVRSGMVCVVAAGVPKETESLIGIMRDEVPRLKSLVWNVNRSRGNTVLAGEFRTLWGEGRVEVNLSGLRFRLSPLSFFQVNPPQAERLYAKALEFAGLTGGERVADLYCGTGAIGLLAAGHAKEVIGVEVVADAVEDARETARENGVENISFLCGDAAEAAARFAAEGMKPDVLFVDPPRKGLAPEVIGSIADMSPERVVYVSCDPATLARDLKLFQERGYHAEKAAAVDMFPRTRHVESVVALTRVVS